METNMARLCRLIESCFGPSVSRWEIVQSKVTEVVLLVVCRL